VLAWGIGDTVWTFTVADLRDPPFPSYADIGFLCVYPPAYGAIVLLLRGRVGRLHTSLWLDGVIGGLAVAAVGTAVVFQAVLKMIGGSPAAVATNLAYPLADLPALAVGPGSLGLLARGVLRSDHTLRLNPLALVLAAATIVFVIVRMALTFAENMRMVSSFRTEARTDALTGLANRRKLLDDLGRA